MEKIVKMPFSGVECNDKEKVCKVWWLQSKDIDGAPKTITVEAKIPFEDLNAGLLLHASMLEKVGRLTEKKEYHSDEITLENMLKNSEVNIQGVEV